MKFNTFAMMGLATLMMTGVACTVTTTDGAGGSGGAGGETTTTGGTTTSVTTGTTTATTSTGVMGCDSGVGMDINSQECDDCITCAFDGNCAGEIAAFSGDPNAQALIDCYTACPSGDTVCFDACDTMYPTTADLYITALSCAVCGECPLDCDAANVCM